MAYSSNFCFSVSVLNISSERNFKYQKMQREFWDVNENRFNVWYRLTHGSEASKAVCFYVLFIISLDESEAQFLVPWRGLQMDAPLEQMLKFNACKPEIIHGCSLKAWDGKWFLKNGSWYQYTFPYLFFLDMFYQILRLVLLCFHNVKSCMIYS